MEHFFVAFPPPPNDEAYIDDVEGERGARGDDKLYFIVSYSEIVCNKIYVLITLEKLQENTFGTSSFPPLCSFPSRVGSKFSNDILPKETFELLWHRVPHGVGTERDKFNADLRHQLRNLHLLKFISKVLEYRPQKLRQKRLNNNSQFLQHNEIICIAQRRQTTSWEGTGGVGTSDW